MSSSSSRKVTLQSSDWVEFEVDISVASESQTIKVAMEEDDREEPRIPLPNVRGEILSKVIEYCKKHVEAAAAADDRELKVWDAEFVKVDNATLFDLTLTANYLNIKGLMDLTCQTIADTMIKGKTPEEIRATFHIENDYTPQEEMEVRSQHQWAFDDQ